MDLNSLGEGLARALTGTGSLLIDRAELNRRHRREDLRDRQDEQLTALRLAREGYTVDPDGSIVKTGLSEEEQREIGRNAWKVQQEQRELTDRERRAGLVQRLVGGDRTAYSELVGMDPELGRSMAPFLAPPSTPDDPEGEAYKRRRGGLRAEQEFGVGAFRPRAGGGGASDPTIRREDARRRAMTGQVNRKISRLTRQLGQTFDETDRSGLEDQIGDLEARGDSLAAVMGTEPGSAVPGLEPFLGRPEPGAQGGRPLAVYPQKLKDATPEVQQGYRQAVDALIQKYGQAQILGPNGLPVEVPLAERNEALRRGVLRLQQQYGVRDE